IDPDGRDGVAIGAIWGGSIGGPVGAVVGGIVGGALEAGALIGVGVGIGWAWDHYFSKSEKPPADRPKYPGNDSTKATGPGWEWSGKPGTKPGDPNGNWHKPESGESLHPDLNHPDPIGPHWDWKDRNGDWWRIHPDDTCVRKP